MRTIYKLSQKNPHSQFLQVSVHFTALEKNVNTLIHLAAWRPGRYQLGNFSKNIRAFKAFDKDGNSINTTKIAKETWEVSSHGLDELYINYDYFTEQVDGGSTYVDEEIWYLNFINCAVYTEQSIDKLCEVLLDIPQTWTIATSLKTVDRKLSAKNFYELVDSPVIAAKAIQHLSYKSADVNFHLWFHGKVDLNNKQQILEDFKGFTDEQLGTMQEFETEGYHFLFQILPDKAYHGVEHLSSTTIVLGPASAFDSADFYDNLLGISSHELFHYWNIIRIRPTEMFPYNFKQENYFTTGYIAEGVTTYYGDLFLVRSGVKSLSWYVDELNKLFKRHFENYGRHYASLAASSQDLWVDGYEAGTPHKKVSIYVKGAIIAMILDLQIILKTKAEQSLDDVMNLLWHNFYKKGKGYSAKNYLEASEQIMGRSLQHYSDNFIEGTEPVEKVLKNLLVKFGFSLKLIENSDLLAKHLGIKTTKEVDQLKIISIAPDSPAEANFRLGDSLVSINNKAIIDIIKTAMFEGVKLKISFWRKAVLRHLEIELKKEQTFFSTYEISSCDELTRLQHENRLRWLKV